MIEVFPCGTVVWLEEEVSGSIIGITIRDESIKYEVGYFINGEYRSCWLSEYEFGFEENTKKVNIGFKK